VSIWLTRHLQTLVGSLGRLSKHSLSTAFTVLVIGLALALPACLHVLVNNAQQATGGWNRTFSIGVYLKTTATLQQARQLAEQVRQRHEVAAVQLVTADEALRELRRDSGFDAAFTVLEKNPLPHALTVQPTPEHTGPEALRALADSLRALPRVESVELDSAWVDRLNAILSAARRGIVLAAALLAMGVIGIIGNTIRLDIQNRREEIEVTKLVGGSDAFVRRPFLYAGVWYGLGGALFAWSLTVIVVAGLSQPVGRIAASYGSAFRLAGLDGTASGVLLASGIGLGWLGSYLAATRHLRRIEPA
jgi:cell division transport system permease protein